MIAKVFATAAAVALLVLGTSCSQFSKSGSGTQTSSSSAQTSQSGASTSASAGGTGGSGPAEMGRGRCEALTGAERDKCFAEDRAHGGVQRSDARK
jgi:hypothetical protein